MSELTPPVGLVLVAHAPLASALQAVARHTFPQCAAELRSVDVAPEWGLEEARQRISAALPGGPVLVLCDVLGATPANAAIAAVRGHGQGLLLHGVNVPMLWRCLCYRHEELVTLAQRALEGGQRGLGLAGADDV